LKRVYERQLSATMLNVLTPFFHSLSSKANHCLQQSKYHTILVLLDRRQHL